MRISLIAAVADNRVIGRNNELPWRLPADMKRFRELTTGHAVIMGRRSHDSIGRPLPQRTNIVVTRRADLQAPGCIVVTSLEQAFSICQTEAEIFVLGGADIYAQTLHRAERLYLTLVHATVAGDTLFPAIDWTVWREIARQCHEPDEHHAYPYTFADFERTA